jgi:hypothetical protein
LYGKLSLCYDVSNITYIDKDMASVSSNNQRIELRVDLETKQIAERAAVALGCSSLTEYIQQQTEIKLNHQQFMLPEPQQQSTV